MLWNCATKQINGKDIIMVIIAMKEFYLQHPFSLLFLY